MIIYRIVGKCEAFKNCGMIHSEPQAGTSKGAIMKQAKAASEKADKAGMKHTFIIKKLTLKKFDQAIALALLGPEGCVEDLIEDSETIGAFASKDVPEAELMPKTPLMAGQKKDEPDDNDLEEADSAPTGYEDDLPF